MTGAGHETRLAFVVSHPIQYLVHRYRLVAQRPGVRVLVIFGSRRGTGPFHDDEFERTVDWGFDLVQGFDAVFAADGDQETDGTPARVQSALEAFQPDRIWIHGYSHRCTRAAWGWGWRRRIPVFLSGDSSIRKERRKGLVRRCFRLIALRAAFSRLAGVLTVGTANEAFYARFGVPRARMIRMPFTVDRAFFPESAEERLRRRAVFRGARGIEPGSVVPLWCGKLVEWKYPGDFIRALESAGLTAVTSLMVGEGPLRDSIEKALQGSLKKAIMTGFLNVPEIPDAYAAADFLVHTCRKESYGLVAVEAAFMGLPMIVPASMGAIGPSDAARPGENAVVYPDGDVEQLAGAIRSMAADRSVREKMGLESRRIYRELELQFQNGVERLLKGTRHEIGSN